MVRRLFFAAITAGVIVGGVISAVHQLTTVPIILEAERHESAAPEPGLARPAADGETGLRPGHGGGSGHVHADWAPSDGLERGLYTFFTTTLLGVGFALLLVTGMALRGERPDMRRGALWGAGGFVAFTLAPAFGLPPEIPGIVTADLADRQIWWIATAAVTAGGLWLLAFREAPGWKGLAVLMIVAPHIVGSPTPHEPGASTAPAELAAQFAATSIGIGALFWILLGGLSGYFFGRSAPAP